VDKQSLYTTETIPIDELANQNERLYHLIGLTDRQGPDTTNGLQARFSFGNFLQSFLGDATSIVSSIGLRDTTLNQRDSTDDLLMSLLNSREDSSDPSLQARSFLKHFLEEVEEMGSILKKRDASNPDRTITDDDIKSLLSVLSARELGDHQLSRRSLFGFLKSALGLLSIVGSLGAGLAGSGSSS
jgi:hypothetical protein